MDMNMTMDEVKLLGTEINVAIELLKKEIQDLKDGKKDNCLGTIHLDLPSTTDENKNNFQHLLNYWKPPPVPDELILAIKQWKDEKDKKVIQDDALESKEDIKEQSIDEKVNNLEKKTNDITEIEQKDTSITPSVTDPATKQRLQIRQSVMLDALTKIASVAQSKGLDLTQSENAESLDKLRTLVETQIVIEWDEFQMKVFAFCEDLKSSATAASELSHFAKTLTGALKKSSEKKELELEKELAEKYGKEEEKMVDNNVTNISDKNNDDTMEKNDVNAPKKEISSPSDTSKEVKDSKVKEETDSSTETSSKREKSPEKHTQDTVEEVTAPITRLTRKRNRVIPAATRASSRQLKRRREQEKEEKKKEEEANAMDTGEDADGDHDDTPEGDTGEDQGSGGSGQATPAVTKSGRLRKKSSRKSTG